MQLYAKPPERSFMPSMIPQDIPVYRIKEGQFYADDELHPEGSVIAYAEEPNLEMEPLNELAVERMGKFLERLDECGRKAADKAGKAYISLLDSFQNSQHIAMQEGRKVKVLNDRKNVPIMGGKQRRNPKVNKIDLSAISSAVNVKEIGSGREEVNSAMGAKF